MRLLQMGWGLIKNSRYAHKAQGALLVILEHTEKKCAYCEKQYGSGLGVPVVDIMQHLKEAHPEKIDIKDVEFYIKAFS